jgi:hypothetical protein
MSFIGDMFKSVIPQSSAQPNPNLPTPGNLPPNQPASIDPNNPHVPVANATPNATVQPAEVRPPMADFADLFKLDPNAQATPDASVKFNIDPAKVLEHSRKANFTSGITPESMAKIAQGGPEAVQEMMNVMNTVAQNVFAQNAISSTQILEKSLDASRTGIKGEMGSVIRNASISETLKAENPLFSVPAAAPLLEMVKDQMLIKFPTASAAEIRQQMNSYLNGLSAELSKVQTAANPELNKGNPQKATTDTDWSNWGLNG